MEQTGAEQPYKEVRDLVEEYRDRCLWFLRRDFVPSNPDEVFHVLDLIERYGDRSAYQRSQNLKRWLLHLSRLQSSER
jgi:hypothetical protein